MYIALHYKGIIAAVHWLQVFMQSSLANKYIYIYIYLFMQRRGLLGPITYTARV